MATKTAECLAIPEIVQLICDQLEPSDCISVALTRKSFLKPALNVVWHHVDSFAPLICCLEEDLYHIDHRGVLVRASLTYSTLSSKLTDIVLDPGQASPASRPAEVSDGIRPQDQEHADCVEEWREPPDIRQVLARTAGRHWV